MATIAQIRTALKTALDTIDGLNVYATVPGQIHTPAVVIRRRRGPVAATIGTTRSDYEFVLTAITSLADDQAAQEALDEFLSGSGTASIEEALEADATLDGTVDFVVLREIEADVVIEYGNISYLGADIVLDVSAA